MLDEACIYGRSECAEILLEEVNVLDQPAGAYLGQLVAQSCVCSLLR